MAIQGTTMQRNLHITAGIAVMLRTILAVVGGCATMAVIVMVTTAIAAATLIPGGIQSMMSPGVPLPRRYLSTNLACSALAAFVGGAVTALIAVTSPLAHGGAFASPVVVMSFLSMKQAQGQ